MQANDEVVILLVEDDDIDATSIERALSKHKLLNKIIRAENGIEGLEILRKHGKTKQFLILLDINMPKMNGIEMLNELRNDPLLHQSVVFILTTSNDEKDRFDAYEKHLAGYILKSDMDGFFPKLVELIDAYWCIVSLPKPALESTPSKKGIT